MNSNNPMDRFVTGFGPTLKQFHDSTDDMELADPNDRVEYLQALQEMQMTNWATGIAVTRRHGLLKKILTEIH